MRVYSKGHLDVYAAEAAAYWSAFWETMLLHVVQVPSFADVFPEFLHPGQRAVKVVMNKWGITVGSRFADEWSVTTEWFSSPEVDLGDGMTVTMSTEGEALDFTLLGGVGRRADGSSEPLPWQMVRTIHQIGPDTFRIDDAVALAKDVALYFTTQRLLGLSESAPEDVSERIRILASEFEAVLAVATREEEIQAFLTANPGLLDLRAVNISPKLKLGSDYVTDYVIELPGHEYVLVEIEAASRKLYTGKNDPTAELSHAVKQVEDWVEWAYDNRTYLASKLPNIHEPQGLVIMGRQASLSDEAAKSLRRRNRLSAIKVRTFDDLVANARAVADNIAVI